MLVSLVLAATLFDPHTGAVTLERGVLSAPLGGELSQAARSWALSRRGELGLPADSTLVNADSFGTRFGASFHLRQELGGVEIYGAELVVTLDRQARVTLVTSSLSAYRTARSTWLVDGAEALSRAARQVPLPALRADGTPHGATKRVYLQVGDEVHAGWLVFAPTLDPRLNLYLAIDATTGETLWQQNRVFRASGLEANVYRLSPGGVDAGVGVTPTARVELAHGDGGSMLGADAGAVLLGTQLDGFNCCVYRDCDPLAPDAGPKRSSGSTMLGGFTVQYDLVACDFRHRATNDATKHDAGTFEYPPLDPPAMGTFTLDDPANSDEFAEVHAFYHLNAHYDWVRSLSRAASPLFPGHQPAIVPFSMRDERRVPARKPAIWSNVVFPDFNQIIANPACVISGTRCVIDGFARLDNAAFIPIENFAQIPLAEYRNDVDTMMIFQGPAADFSYDAPVLWHELGHGVITSTANLGLGGLAIDRRSANNEGGAMHEAFSDYFAAAFGGDSYMGRYVGPRVTGAGGMTGIRTEQFLRSLDNTLSCPHVLNGEVHDDSQHVSAALWRAREDLFKGSDDGGTFDATFYAMLVSLTSNADFAQAAQAMTAHVSAAFPDGGAAMASLFDQRGVTNCSKVIDLPSGQPRPLYGVGGRGQTLPMLSAGSFIPGPVQLKLAVPQGLRQLQVTAAVGQDPLGLGGGAPTLRALAKAAAPIEFTRNGAALQNDATALADMRISNGGASATVDLVIPCDGGTEVYVTIGNSATGPATLQNVTVTATPLVNCMLPVPDAGRPDAGSADGGSTDGGGGTMTRVSPALGVVQGQAPGGCGCSSAPLALPLLLVLARALRRRR